MASFTSVSDRIALVVVQEFFFSINHSPKNYTYAKCMLQAMHGRTVESRHNLHHSVEIVQIVERLERNRRQTCTDTMGAEIYGPHRAAYGSHTGALVCNIWGRKSFRKHNIWARKSFRKHNIWARKSFRKHNIWATYGPFFFKHMGFF